MTTFVCIGSPYALGERLAPGSEVDQVRDSGIVAELNAAWLHTEPEFAEGLDPIVATNRALAAAINVWPDRFPLMFAGDCMGSIGAVKGLLDRGHNPLGIVWYDAHGDFNTPETSPSGFLGGMPLAMLVGLGDLAQPLGLDLEPLAAEHIILTDARDLDPGEAELVQASAITHLTDVNELLNAPLPDVPLYIHLDIDVLCLEDMPATSYPAAGGSTLAEVAATVTHLARTGKIAGILFALWNSDLATDERPLNSTLALVRAFVAGMAAS